MLAFQQGDLSAFELLFNKYRSPIFSFLVRQSGNRDTAADLTQDVFAKLIRSAASFQHQSKFSTWIYTIARNAAVDAARKAKHRRHVSLDDNISENGFPLLEKIANNDQTPDRSAAADALKNDLITAIEKLPKEQKEVFLLREYHGMAFQEIAQVVGGAKIGTVKSRMRYALEGLRKSLTKHEDYARTLQ